MNKWLRSSPSYFKAQAVDMDKGIIEGVAVITMGEAKGHGVHIDSEFLDAIVEQGNALKQGLKVRFGHPSMSSTALGTFLGREKNFRRVGDVVKADLYLSNTAKESPNGDIYTYVLEMAQNESDMLGTSIVFTSGDNKKLDGDEKEYATLERLLANDVVDDPAANPNGLFSAYNKETFAGQVSEFLDIHPEIFELVRSKPEVIESFLERYEEYKQRQNGDIHMEQENVIEVEEIVTAESEALETTEEVPVEELNAESEVIELEVEEVQEVKTAKESFEQIEEAFGTDIAVTALKHELSFDEAKDLYLKAVKAELEDAKEQIVELNDKLSQKVTAPVKPSEPMKKRKSIINIK